MSYYPPSVYGREYIDDLTVATGLTPPPSTNAALVQADGGYVKFWLNGVPTNETGMVLKAYEAPFLLEGSAVTGSRFIRKYTTQDPSLAVTYLFKFVN